jgi:hypothetical protein
MLVSDPRCAELEALLDGLEPRTGPRALDILRRHSAHDVHVHAIPATASA